MDNRLWRLRHARYGDRYDIECVWASRKGYYELYIRLRPDCPYPAGNNAGHIIGRDLVCVMAGREPRTLDRAKAIALHWVNGFSEYRRTGRFPNGPVRVDADGK